jgi:hypothetical protein
MGYKDLRFSRTRGPLAMMVLNSARQFFPITGGDVQLPLRKTLPTIRNGAVTLQDVLS